MTTEAEIILGPIRWVTPERGYCDCPGKHLHSRPNGARDCRVIIDGGAPSLHCVHSSCADVVETKKRELRSRLCGRSNFRSSFRRDDMLELQRAERLKRQLEEMKESILRERVMSSRQEILRAFQWEEAGVFEDSPVRLFEHPEQDWRLHLSLFEPENIVWLGGKYDSAGDDKPDAEKERCRAHFQPVHQWLQWPQAPAEFICPNPFQNGSHARTSERVQSRSFFVVESDTLPKADCLALFNWLRQALTLRAIIDSAGKSVHGWFNYPTPEQLAELTVILPALGCDPASFKPSQPYRLAGATRSQTQKLHKLLWIQL